MCFHSVFDRPIKFGEYETTSVEYEPTLVEYEPTLVEYERVEYETTVIHWTKAFNSLSDQAALGNVILSHCSSCKIYSKLEMIKH